MPNNDDSKKPVAPAPAATGGSDNVVRDHRSAAGGDNAPPVRDHRSTPIKHVFVLMLENRSFDHMLGFSGITGTDIDTGEPTQLDGVIGPHSLNWKGKTYEVTPLGASDRVDTGPGHDFPATLEQLCGPGATFKPGGDYPPIDINNSGFVSNYAKSNPDDPGLPLRCLNTEQVPVITQLANEFLVCDRWFSSVPGPTETNRFYLHCGTSGWFDDAPGDPAQAAAQELPWDTYNYPNIFMKLDEAKLPFRIYDDDSYPNVAELSGISSDKFHSYADFAKHVADPSYDAVYTFIEPSYNVSQSYRHGNSQHPSGSVAAGERFIKETYEAIRRSPVWDTCMFVIVWDEHGGFYDHIAPPPIPPAPEEGYTYGFRFDRLGVRVPAVVISPLIARNQISHRRLEHCAIPATLIRMFHLSHLTGRVAAANTIHDFAKLATPRTDAPMTLTAAWVPPSMPRVVGEGSLPPSMLLSDAPEGGLTWVARATVGMHLRLAPAAERDAIVARAKAIKTVGDLLAYQAEVDALILADRKARIPSAAAPVHA